jgi:hypothetical protein
MEEIIEGQAHIKGWGVDADRENEPTYPIKKYTGDDHKRLNYQRPTQQTANVEILKSNERPSVSAVFGTSTPPSGLSGAIRRYAFRYSEGSWGHWLPLILADRINVIEGVIDDLKKGYVPNIFAERGWKAEWKYNRKGMVKKIATGILITSAVAAYLVFRKNKKMRA